jgi:hypothetical protein
MVTIGQEMFRLLWNLKVYYRPHRRPSQEPYPAHTKLIQALTSYLFTIWFKFFLPSTLDSPSVSFYI